MIIYNRTEYKTLSPKQYKKEKKRLQVELLKLQEWVIKNNKRIGIVFEGRDAAGKGSTIKRFIENMMPKTVSVIELGVPNKKQRKRWFDRSWYSRAIIQPVMGYCNETQYKYFMKNVNKWENHLINNGIILIKFYLSISKENQQLRFHLREINPLKYWKLSPNDWKSHKNWQVLTKFKEYMFKHTSTEISPWVIINSDNKMIARLNAMRYVLAQIDYEGKERIKIKKWNREDPSYQMTVNNVLFEDLNKEQYEFLYQIKANEQ